MTTPGALHQRACRQRQRAGLRLPDWDERFNARLVWVGECLEWQGARDLHGYGRVSRVGVMVLAHRAALERGLGPIPSSLNVRHSCDNPPCCNPAHLFPCPTLDNVADMLAKDRDRAGQSMAKLTAAAASEIRRRHGRGESQVALAAAFGVTKSTIWALLHGRTWQ